VNVEDGADVDAALSRFADVIGSRYPTWLEQLRPGLDAAGLGRLREAVSPYLLPRQVEALYRWHDGGDSGVFGGWRMRSVDELIRWYRFTCEDMESPPTWLPVFDDQIVNVVTLDVPGMSPSDPSVWYGHTHDGTLERLFDSVAAMLHVVCDAAERDALAEVGDSFGLRTSDGVEPLDGSAWSAFRLSRCPGAYQYPDPPAGTSLSRFPEAGWPRAWLLPLGVTDESQALRGPTHTVAELIAAAAGGPVYGTIRGRAVTGAGGAGFWNPVVDDGSGRLVVACDTASVPLSIGVGLDGEFDVLLEDASPPDPITDDDPRVAALANSLRPQLPTALALAARPVLVTE
jgi:cell wall assembly regulator SMI1